MGIVNDDLDREEGEPPFRRPREGASCAYHPETEAVVRCVLCDKDVCFGCFFPEHARCQRCVETHPDEVAEAVPFECARVGRVRGFWRTIGAAFRPYATAPSFAIGESLVFPFVFALLTFVPLAMIRGIIPYTTRLHFGPFGAVNVTAGSDAKRLVLDVFRASGLSLAESLLQVAVMAVCYVSLSSAFGRPEVRRIATRTVAYRAFLLPFAGKYGLLPMLLAWLAPAHLVTDLSLLTFGAIPLVPLAIALQRSVRSTGRVDVGPGLAIALVPSALFIVVSVLTELAVVPGTGVAPS